jgi:hypothetical protein
MVKPGKNSDESDDAAARQAAEVAVELSEASDLADSPEASPSDDDAATSVAAGGRRGGMRRMAGVIGTARTGMARQSATVARRTTEAAGRGGRAATRGMSSAVTWLTGQVVAMGPRLSIRDQARLRGQFPALADEEIAELLIERAGRASATVGGATGAWSALPVLPAFPAEIAAETLAVIGIELKLVAELHEILGLPAQGSGTERARAYLAAWAHRRGVFAVPGGLVFATGSPLARMLRRRLVGRVRRSVFSLAPLLTGAVAGAVINRAETRKVGREILTDLRRHRREIDA